MSKGEGSLRMIPDIDLRPSHACSSCTSLVHSHATHVENLHMHALEHHIHIVTLHTWQTFTCSSSCMHTHILHTHTHKWENENKTKLNCGRASILMYEVSVSVHVGSSICTRVAYVSHESSVSLM